MKVYVKAPARLHLGIIDLGGELDRLFGGLGLAINCPNVILQAEKSQRLSIKGEKSELVRPFVELFLERYNVEPKVAVNVEQTIPQHIGLGSGTQHALATAVALARVFNINASVQELATTMGRGKVSGVGTAVFDKGGFVVDGGVKIRKNKSILPDSFPPVIFQEPFPDDWFFTVAIPKFKRGLSGEIEAKAFNCLQPMSMERAGRLSRLILMSLLPALKEKDIKAFGNALTQIQNIVGDSFASVQGGRFSSSPSAKCIAYMLKHGALGAGQSSWGPTVYGLIEGAKAAEKLSVEVQGFLQKSSGGHVFSAAANNRGAYIKTTP